MCPRSGRGGRRDSWPGWRSAELKTELTATRVNPLIGRREVTFEIQEPSTPSRSEVRREIAVLLKADIDRVWVRRIETKSGTNTTVGLAHVYDDAARALEVEPEHIIKRNRSPEKQAEEG